MKSRYRCLAAGVVVGLVLAISRTFGSSAGKPAALTTATLRPLHHALGNHSTANSVLLEEWRQNPLLQEESSGRMGPREIRVKGRVVRQDALKWQEHHPAKDAVFAMGMGYDPRVWRLFLGSLRSTGFAGDVVVGVSESDAANEDILRLASKYDAILYQLSFQCMEKPGSRKAPCALLGFYEADNRRVEPAPISNLRYELLQAWVQLYDESSVIFIIDFRDVFFQANPFPRFHQILSAAQGQPAIIAVEEAKALTIGLRGKGNAWNTLWTHKCFGIDVVRAMTGETVFCSGTTAGNRAGMRAYLDLMLAELTWRDCKDTGGADQGVHNFLVRLILETAGTGNTQDQSVDPIKIFVEEQGIGAVNTLSAAVRLGGPLHENGQRDPQGYVLNFDGTKSAVVHQWDRDQSLKTWVRSTLTPSFDM